MIPYENFCLPNLNNDIYLHNVEILWQTNNFNKGEKHKSTNRTTIKPLIIDEKFML